MTDYTEEVLPTDLRWHVVKNTTAQGVGRVLIAAGRLVIAGIIVRVYGKLTFGEYSLVMGLLGVAEWVVDFGVTEAVVREICQRRGRRVPLLRIVTAFKGLQVPAAYLLLLGILLVLRYPEEIVQAGLVGGLAIVFYGGVLVYRVQFRVAMTMEREIAGEAISVLVMIGLVALASERPMGLSVLLGCHVVSRMACFGTVFLLGRRRFVPSVTEVAWSDLGWCLRASAAMGTAGLLVGVYQVVDLVLLSKLSPEGVPYYAAGQRLTWPSLMALAAIGSTLYPILSSYWPSAPAAFGRALQRGIDTVAVLAGLVLCSFLAGADFFMRLIGPDLGPGANALRVLAVLAMVRAINATLGPVLYAVHAQRQALQFITVAVIAKVVVLSAIAPRFGYLGVAYAALGVELCFSTVPSVYLVRHRTRHRLRWNVPLKALLIGSGTGTGAALVLPGTGLVAALAAPALYIPLAFLTRSAHLSDVRSLWTRKTP